MLKSSGYAERSGWRPEEEDMLFAMVEEVKRSARPLKAAFEAVAERTGRKPNSIRNYYYQRVRSDERLTGILGQNSAFVPFTQEEMTALLRRVLADQAKGISVRACTLAMGNGENKAMLRYQNKYRSLVKGNPELVKRVIRELEDEGIAAHDPYKSSDVRRAGRPRKSSHSLLDTLSRTINDLDRVEGVDVATFFECISALANGAARAADASSLRERDLDPVQAGVDRLRALTAELKARLDSREQELMAQDKRFELLLSMFRQLMSVNREFLAMTSVVKVSSLSEYIRELSQNVEDCERVIVEYGR